MISPLKQGKWDVRFLRLAHEVAKWSKDPSTKVGCILVKDKKVVSMGYNGFPAGISDDLTRLEDRATKYEMTVHAEVNAVTNAALHGVSTAGSTAYITFSPCSRCASVLINAGISTVVISARNIIPDRWLDNFRLAAGLLNEAGVGYEIIDPNSPE
jgi:dCMP deaminase